MIAIRQAIARTLERTTGAGKKIACAKTQAETDPETARALI